jgi:assimilatory nitrate reductase catalytic subunit
MQVFCLRIQAIQDKNGPASVAFISTGQMVTEEMAFLGALAKFGMACSTATETPVNAWRLQFAAYKQSFGFDAPPFTYKDFEESDVIVLIGSNLCIAHPILWQRILRNPHDPEIIVIDPRSTETAMAATRHYAIQPKSDLTLLYSLARLMIELGAVKHDFIREHTNGFEEFRRFRQYLHTRIRQPHYRPRRSKRSAGLRKIIAAGKRVSFWWTMGCQPKSRRHAHCAGDHQSRAHDRQYRSARAPARIPSPVNAMRWVPACSATPPISSAATISRTRLTAKNWRASSISRARIFPLKTVGPTIRSSTGIRDDKIKGLWIIATNTLHSWINQHDVQSCSRSSISSSCRTCTPPPKRHRPPTWCCRLQLGREGWYIH